jgi:hypothetical protein
MNLQAVFFGRARRLCLLGLTVAASAVWAQPSVATAAERWPAPVEPFVEPARDAFYQSPAADILAAVAPGTILRQREVPTKAYYWFDVPARSWQLMFRSTDSKGQPVASITTVMVPFNAPSVPSARVLVSYQPAYDGLTLTCAPSQSLMRGTQWEHVLINRVLKRGWILSVPDYEGLQSLWGAAVNSGQGVLDGVRAAVRFGPLGLPGKETRVGLVGYSGGALASNWAAELAPTYAPEIKLQAVATGGVPVDLGNVARKIDGGLFAGLYVTMTASLARAYPEVDPGSVLNERGLTMIRNAQDMCAGQFMTGAKETLSSLPFKRMKDYVKVPDLLEIPAMKRVIAENRLGQRVPQAPLYIYQGTLDQVMPIDDVDQLVQTYCRAGVKVQYERTINDHLILPFTGFGGAVDFISDRFEGKPAPSQCAG